MCNPLCNLAKGASAKSSSLNTTADSDDEFVDAVRPITMEDLRLSLTKLKESKIACGMLAPNLRIELD
ncbi:hypothetical protein JYU34_001471 [Plutella xylostella]|uniref:Uncharacterized protein n=1 Tax=Plutella xylostella TaxID=51655 RepID=A0ABQ7R420_PLUXY|nr:hypothetical protein JYU34_001471 [Plutella xylostella]